jgi:hypothetical protein
VLQIDVRQVVYREEQDTQRNRRILKRLRLHRQRKALKGHFLIQNQPHRGSGLPELG